VDFTLILQEGGRKGQGGVVHGGAFKPFERGLFCAHGKVLITNEERVSGREVKVPRRLIGTFFPN